MRLIDADALKRELSKYEDLYLWDVLNVINEQQTLKPRYPRACPCSECEDRCSSVNNCNAFEDWITGG